MTPRRAAAKLLYNGVDITADLTGNLLGVTYTDPADGQSDSVSVTLDDRDRRWLTTWHPTEKDRLALSITTYDWTAQGDVSALDCGSFLIDDFSAGGPPTQVSISGVSAPRDDAFSSTKRSKGWEDVTIAEIQTEIAGRYGLSAVYDADDIHIKALEQADTTDSAFLESVCNEYGLCLKVYSAKLVIYDRAKYKQKPAAVTITPADLSGGWSAAAALTGAYTGAKLAYTDPATGQDVTASIGDGPRWLTVDKKADNAADAQRLVTGALEAANHGVVSMSLTIMGSVGLAAGMTVNISGWGWYDGKYFIDSASHSIGGGFTTSLELVKVIEV